MKPTFSSKVSERGYFKATIIKWFFDIVAYGEITEHYHGTPQYGVVVEGEMELSVNGEIRVYRKGGE